MLLRILPAIGNADAMERVRAAAEGSQENLHSEAIRQLSNWPDPAAIPHLQKIFQATENQTYRILALRGMARLISVAGNMPEQDKLAMLRDAMQRSPGVEEKRLILSGLSSLSTVEALEYSVSLLTDASIKSEAEVAIAQIARRAAAQNEQKTKEILKGVIDKISSETVIKQIQSML